MSFCYQELDHCYEVSMCKSSCAPSFMYRNILYSNNNCCEKVKAKGCLRQQKIALGPHEISYTMVYQSWHNVDQINEC